MTRAVIFDLWDTLINFDQANRRAFIEHAAVRLGRDTDEFEGVWDAFRVAREVGPLAASLAAIGIDAAEASELEQARLEFTRRALVPREGAVETLHELRRRGLKAGLISVCSDEIPTLWPETAFAGLFESEVFSCQVGLRKPDPRIYALACKELGVAPAEAVFVGDGANDELAGAERAGLRAVLIHRPGEEPPWPEARRWRGPRITSIPEVLDLV